MAPRAGVGDKFILDVKCVQGRANKKPGPYGRGSWVRGSGLRCGRRDRFEVVQQRRQLGSGAFDVVEELPRFLRGKVDLKGRDAQLHAV